NGQNGSTRELAGSSPPYSTLNVRFFLAPLAYAWRLCMKILRLHEIVQVFPPRPVLSSVVRLGQIEERPSREKLHPTFPKPCNFRHTFNLPGYCRTDADWRARSVRRQAGQRSARPVG